MWVAPVDWCPGWWSFNQTKGFKNGSWHPVHQWTTVGQWQCGTEGCHCRPQYINGTTAPPILAANHGYSHFRTVTQAGFAMSYGRAYAGVEIVP